MIVASNDKVWLEQRIKIVLGIALSQLELDPPSPLQSSSQISTPHLLLNLK